MASIITAKGLGKAALVGAGAMLAVIAAPALADVKAGVDAWTAGDFSRAVVEWQGPAAAGDPDALFNLAQAYRLGRGVEVDNARARRLYEDAARLGHVKAADNYGLMLFQEGEQEKAMPLIRAAADRGDPRAQYVLGLSHFNADYAPRDWVRAYALMTLVRWRRWTSMCRKPSARRRSRWRVSLKPGRGCSAPPNSPPPNSARSLPW